MASPNSSILLLLLLIAISSTAAQNPFICTTPAATCNALVDYVSPLNGTTLSAVKTLFTITHLRSILAANNLPPTTLSSYQIPPNQTVKIPFPCICNNGTGISNRRPIYTVVQGDGLYHIAAEIFNNLFTFQELQAVNKIANESLIDVGQKLFIPLPCSCDDVGGEKVVHYGHVVAAGSSVEGIALRYNTSQDTLMKLNNLVSPQDLMAGSVLDVPLRACSSSVNINSLDYPLLVPNDTYVFTAKDCVRCKCDAANWVLQCEPSQINSSCAPIQCEGPGNLYLGNTTTSGCNSTTCAYAGYNGRVPTTVLALESTCPAPDNKSSAMSLQGWRWNGVVIFIHIMLLCIAFLD